MNSHCSNATRMKEDKYSRGWGTGKILTSCTTGKAKKGAKKGIPARRRNPKPRKRNTSPGGCAAGGCATGGGGCAAGGCAAGGCATCGGGCAAGGCATGGGG